MTNCCLCGGPTYRWQETLSRAMITVHRWCFFMLQTDEEFEGIIFGMDVDKQKQYRAEWEKFEKERVRLREMGPAAYMCHTGGR